MEAVTASRVEKPWGFEIHWAVTDRYIGKILHINGGHSLSLQYHRTKDETQLVVSGAVDVEMGREGEALQRCTLRAGEVIRFRPGVRHRVTALEDSEIFEVSTPELDDIVRLEDQYGRVPGAGAAP